MSLPLTIAKYRMRACTGCRLSLIDPALWLPNTLPVCNVLDIDWEDESSAMTVDVVLIEGAVTDLDSVQVLKRIRRQSDIVVLLGECAIDGITAPSLASIHGTAEDLMDDSIDKLSNDASHESAAASNTNDAQPLDRMPIERVIRIDHHLRGCPPSPEEAKAVLRGIAEQKQAEELRFRRPEGEDAARRHRSSV